MGVLRVFSVDSVVSLSSFSEFTFALVINLWLNLLSMIFLSFDEFETSYSAVFVQSHFEQIISGHNRILFGNFTDQQQDFSSLARCDFFQLNSILLF